MTSTKNKNKKHILLNNLGSKHSLLMKFGEFTTKETILLKNSTKTVTRKLVPNPLVLQNIKHNLYWKMIFLK